MLLLAAVAGCSPALNWREVRPDHTRLHLLLPCKPDKAEKRVPFDGQFRVLRMLGCEADGATFAVMVLDAGDASRTAHVLDQWQSLTLAHIKAAPVGPGGSQAAAFKLAGATLGPPPVLVKAQGRRADGSPVSGQAVYFAQGSQVFQGVIYAEKIVPEVADTFFTSLQLK